MILDLDGLLWIAGKPAPYAITFIENLRRHEVPFCVLTNDCSVSRGERTAALRGAALDIKPSELLTPPVIAAGLFAKLGIASIAYLGNEAPLADLRQAAVVGSKGPVDAVVIGDLFDSYRRQAVEDAVNHIRNGARLIALQRKLFWSDGAGAPKLDVGFWVHAFEGATGVQALVVGKPDPQAYLAAVEALGLTPEDVAATLMLSDDVDCDLSGAHNAGLRTMLVAEQPLATGPNWIEAVVPSLESAWQRLKELS